MSNPGSIIIIDTLVQANAQTYALVNAKDVGGDSSTNVLPAATFPAFSGDVTKAAGSLATTVTAIQNKGITLATGFLKYNGSAFAFDNSTYLTSLSGAVLTDQTSGQTIGATGARLTKLWATDITVTNAISGAVTGNAGTVTNATFTTALTVNTGTLTLSGNAANTSVLTVGAGAVSVSGANTGDQTGGTPALTLGTANTAGESTNFIRRDDTILVFDVTAPSTQAFGDAAAVGVATVAARRDHKHAMMAAPTSVSGNAGTVTGATFTTALTVNTGTVTLSGDAANTSALTIGAGAVSVSGTNTGDNAANSSTMYIGTTSHALNRASATETLTGIQLTSPNINEAVALTTTATKLNYLTSATGTAGTATGKVVFDTAPTFVTSLTTPSVLATANDSGALGASGTAFADLFLASGGVINWAAANATLTHSTGLLTSNVPLSLGTSNALTCGSIELGAASDTTITRTGAGAIAVEGAAVLLSGGALGTPSSGTVTNLTGTASININGTVGATTPTTGAFTTITTTGQNLFGVTSNATYKYVLYDAATDMARTVLFDYATTNTNIISSPMTLKQTTNGNMADGYGVGFLLAIQDDAGAENFIARMAGTRNGADNTGKLQFDVWNGGAIVTVASLFPTGRVGIGTSAPLRGLDINEASGNCLRLIYNDADGTAANYADFLVSSGGVLTVTPSGSAMTLGTGTALTCGSIELGAASDTTITRTGAGTIAVEGTAVLLSGGALGTPSSGTVTNLTGTASININGTVGATTPTTGKFTTLTTTSLVSTAATALGITPAAGYNLNVSLSTTGDLAVNTDQLYVDTSAAAVGIGTTAPFCRLDVVGGATTATTVLANLRSNATGNNTGTTLRFTNSTNADSAVNAEITALRTNAPTSGYTDLIFSAYGAITERMRLVSNGRVGIGTSAPDRHLEVNDAAGNCLRLTYNDSDGSAANYADFLVSSGGNLTLTTSGTDLTITNNLLVSGNTTLGNASTDTVTATGRLIVRTTASDPQHATAGSRPAGSVGEIAYYSGKMYFCTNAATPTWEKITST